MGVISIGGDIRVLVNVVCFKPSLQAGDTFDVIHVP